MILVRQSRPLSYTPPSDLPFSLLLYHNFLIRQKWYHSSSSVMQCQALPIIDGWVYIIMEHLLQPLQYSGFQHWYLICTGYKGLESNPWRWRNHSWGNAINAWYLSWYLLASSPDQAAWQWAGNEVRCTITMTTILFYRIVLIGWSEVFLLERCGILWIGAHLSSPASTQWCPISLMPV